MPALAIRSTPFSPVPLSRAPVPVLAALALAAAATLWRTSFVAAKVVLADLPPVAVAFFRFAIAAVVLVPLACRGRCRAAFGAQPALLGLTGVTLFFLFQNAGLRHASAAHATLILGGGLPVLTALLAACFLGERPTPRQLAALTCSLGGVVDVAGGGGAANSSLWGDGMLLLAADGGAAYSVLRRQVFAGPDPLAVLAGSTLWGALLLALPATIEATRTGLVWPSREGLLLLLYLGLGCSALAFALCAFGLRHLTAAQSAVVGASELPVGLVAAALLLGDVLASTHLVGAGLLLAGGLVAVDQTPSASDARRSSDRGTADHRPGIPAGIRYRATNVPLV